MKKGLCWFMLMVLLLLPTSAARADDGTGHDRVIIGQNFTLSHGEAIDGDLVVIGGETSIEVGAAVAGDLVVIGASLRLDGTASGSAVVIGGNVSLGDSSSVGRDLVALGGSFQRAEGSQISGDIITNLAIARSSLPATSTMSVPRVPLRSDARTEFGPLGRVIGVFFEAMGLAVFAMLLTALLRPQLDLVAHAVQDQPFAAGSLGLLTVFLAPLAIALMAITLILIPLALVAALLLALAWLFGMVAISQIVGEKLSVVMHRTWEPVLTAGLGAVVLGFTLAVSNQVPCIGWLASGIVGLIGLGAATVTLFGTHPFGRGALAVDPAMPGDRSAPLPPPS